MAPGGCLEDQCPVLFQGGPFVRCRVSRREGTSDCASEDVVYFPRFGFEMNLALLANPLIGFEGNLSLLGISLFSELEQMEDYFFDLEEIPSLTRNLEKTNL